MKRCADPCEDFYEYSCGSWIKKAKFLPPRRKYVMSDSDLQDQIEKEIRILLEGELLHKNNKAAEFYASCLPQFANGSLNTAPLSQFRRVFKNLSNANSFAYAVGTLYSQADLDVFFTPQIAPDQDHPERYALYLLEGGFTSPPDLTAKDIGTDATSNETSAENSGLVVRRACLDAAAKSGLIPNVGLTRLAETVLELERNLESFSPSIGAFGDYSRTRQSLNSFPAELHIRTYLSSARIDASTLNNSVLVLSPEYFDSISTFLAQAASDPATKEVVRAYMAYQLVYRFATIGLLGRDLYNAVAMLPGGTHEGISARNNV
jgi:Peptidase family M13